MTKLLFYPKDQIQIDQRLQSRRTASDEKVVADVAAILKNVQTKGDSAVKAYTKKFDGHDHMVVTSEEIEKAMNECSTDTIEALTFAQQRIEAYHQKQLPTDIDYTDREGVRLGNIWKSIDSVGLYVPGGLASYPSSVLMNAVPAKVAGVTSLTMVVPAPANVLNPAVLVAAKLSGVDRIYKIGGAQAIAALAYGTESITPVDKIIGPGNQYVAEAKRQVFGVVGIDMVAGPSEVLIVSDNQTPARWVATDLLAQSEHDTHAMSILITDDADWAVSVQEEVKQQLKTLSRSDIASRSWKDYGMIIVVDDLDQSFKLVNHIAPEHLQLAVEDDRASVWLQGIKHAGAIFLGRYTPESIGDYIAGPSHVLPTSGTARFSSGLSVYDFLKRISLMGCSQTSFDRLSKATSCLATEEGLDAHANAIIFRNQS